MRCVRDEFARRSRGVCGGFAKSLRGARRVPAVLAGDRGMLTEQVWSVERSQIARGCVWSDYWVRLRGARDEFARRSRGARVALAGGDR